MELHDQVLSEDKDDGGNVGIDDKDDGGNVGIDDKDDGAMLKLKLLQASHLPFPNPPKVI